MAESVLIAFFFTSATFLTFQLSAGQTQPFVHITPQSARKNISDSVVMNCSMFFAYDKPILWSRFDRKTGERQNISYGNTLKVNDSRYTVHYEPNHPNATYILQIKNIRVKDAGVYECTIMKSLLSNVSDNFELQVLFPAAINDKFAKIVNAREGEPTRLECNATGYPPPLVSWRRQHNVLLATGRTIHRKGILEIPSVKKEDRGVYLCYAENGVGQNRPHRKAMLLQVHYTPVLTASQPRIGQSLKRNADLTCRIEAHPHPNIAWYKNGQILSENGSYSISIKTILSTRQDYTNTTLRVKSIEPWQYGVYACWAENRMGSREQEIELFETNVNTCPSSGLCDDDDVIDGTSNKVFEDNAAVGLGS